MFLSFLPPSRISFFFFHYLRNERRRGFESGRGRHSDVGRLEDVTVPRVSSTRYCGASVQDPQSCCKWGSRKSNPSVLQPFPPFFLPCNCPEELVLGCFLLCFAGLVGCVSSPLGTCTYLALSSRGASRDNCRTCFRLQANQPPPILPSSSENSGVGRTDALPL